jgi:hypothetical protein
MGPKGVPDTKTDRPTDRRSKHQLTKYWDVIVAQLMKMSLAWSLFHKRPPSQPDLALTALAHCWGADHSHLHLRQRRLLAADPTDSIRGHVHQFMWLPLRGHPVPLWGDGRICLWYRKIETGVLIKRKRVWSWVELEPSLKLEGCWYPDCQWQ